VTKKIGKIDDNRMIVSNTRENMAYSNNRMSVCYIKSSGDII